MIAILPIDGKWNPSDIGTKYLGRTAVEQHAAVLLNLSEEEVASVKFNLEKAESSRNRAKSKP